MNEGRDTDNGQILSFRHPSDKYFASTQSLRGEPSEAELAEGDKIWQEALRQGRIHAPEAMESVEARWTTSDVSHHVGRSRRTILRWVRDGDLLGIRVRGVKGYRFPHFQFIDLPRLGKRSINPEVLKVKQTLDIIRMDPFTQAQFFLTESPRLDGLTPLEIIRRRRFLERLDDIKSWALHGFREGGN